MEESSVPFPILIYNIDGTNMSLSEVVNIAPKEGQILVSFTLQLNWEALAFREDFSTGIKYFNHKRKLPITPLKYVFTRLKCCDNKFSANCQYIFYVLDEI